jgi:hypothetical protein
LDSSFHQPYRLNGGLIWRFHVFIGWTGEEADHNSSNTLPVLATEITVKARSRSTLSTEVVEF